MANEESKPNAEVIIPLEQLITYTPEDICRFILETPACRIIQDFFRLIDMHETREVREDVFWGSSQVGREINNLAYFMCKEKGLFDDTCDPGEREIKCEVARPVYYHPISGERSQEERIQESYGYWLARSYVASFSLFRLFNGVQVFVRKAASLYSTDSEEAAKFPDHWHRNYVDRAVSAYIQNLMLAEEDTARTWTRLEEEFIRVVNVFTSFKMLSHEYLDAYVKKYGLSHSTLHQALNSVMLDEGPEEGSLYARPLGSDCLDSVQHAIPRFFQAAKACARFQFGTGCVDYAGRYTALLRGAKFVSFNMGFNRNWMLREVPTLYKLVEETLAEEDD